jgi:hypothetical protein
MKRAVFAIVTVLVLTGSAFAQQPRTAWPGESCGAWVRGDGINRLGARGYIIGFVSAVNLFCQGPNSAEPDRLAGVDEEGLDVWLEQYCTAHPLHRLIDAAKGFFTTQGANLGRACFGQ